MGQWAMSRGKTPSTSTSLAKLAEPGALPPTFDVPADLVEPAQRFLAAARALNTRRARRSDWAVFVAWCAERGRAALPAGADTVFAFLTEQAEKEAKRPATLRRYLTSISTAHDGAGQPNPTRDARIGELMAGILRELGGRQRQAAPLTIDVLRQILHLAAPAAREWAVLCFGQAIACRRSELCALDLSDVVIDPRGVAVTFRRSKTDQEGRGQVIGVLRREDVCPVLALECYLRERGDASGPLFHGVRVPRMTTKDVDRIVKRWRGVQCRRLLGALAAGRVCHRRTAPGQGMDRDHGAHATHAA
jgi:integrase